MPAPSPIIKGLATIKWGSSGTVAAGALTAAIFVRGSFTDKNGQAFEIEDNEGFSKALVFLADGFDATIECVYDSAITWPAIGDAISIKRPRDAAALGGYVASIEDTVERKKEAMLSLKIHCRPGVA